MKFIADSCWNFNLPAGDGEVSINTATKSGNVGARSSEKVSIAWGILSSRITKSLLVRPGTKFPFLSVTVIGKRTRRMGIRTDCGSSGNGVGLAFGFCAETVSDAAAIKQTAKKEVITSRIRAVDMRSGL